MTKKICLALSLITIILTKPVTASDKYFTETPILIGHYALEGKLTLPNLPASTKTPPVAILIQGTGQANKDSAFGRIAPFKDIAHGLAKHGIASIRFNKRFYQHPPIPYNMTLQTEILEDISYAINFAYNHEGLGQIYLVGFSLGGILAPTIAYNHYDKVAGIVSLAGSPRHFSEIWVSQSDMLVYIYANAMGMDVPEGLPIGHLINLVLSTNANSHFINNLAHQWGFPISYLLSLNEIDTLGIIDYVNIPMLILHGSKDLQLLVDDDFIAWKELLSDRDNVHFILYEGLNHFFTPHVPELGYFQTQAPAEVYYQVITDIAGWINGQ